MQFSMRRALAATIATATLSLVASGCDIGSTHTSDDNVLGIEYDGGATQQSAVQVQGPSGPVWVTTTGWGPGPYEIVADDTSVPDVVDATVTHSCRGAIAMTANIHTPGPYQLAPTTQPGPAFIDGTPVTLHPDGPGQMSIGNPGALTNADGDPVTNSSSQLEGIYAGNGGAVVTVVPIRGAITGHCH